MMVHTYSLEGTTAVSLGGVLQGGHPSCPLAELIALDFCPFVPLLKGFFLHIPVTCSPLGSFLNNY